MSNISMLPNLVPRVYSLFDMKKGAKKIFSAPSSMLESEKTLGTRLPCYYSCETVSSADVTVCTFLWWMHKKKLKKNNKNNGVLFTIHTQQFGILYHPLPEETICLKGLQNFTRIPTKTASSEYKFKKAIFFFLRFTVELSDKSQTDRQQQWQMLVICYEFRDGKMLRI